MAESSAGGLALPVEPVSKQAFEPFGTVVTIDGAEKRIINEGTTVRHHDLTPVDVGDEEGRVCVSLFRSDARPKPIAIRMLERHPLGSQTFFPLQAADWLVVVAEGETAPDLGTLRCFRVPGDRGVTYAKNAWHHPVLTLVRQQDFLVIDRVGSGDNLEEHWFDEAGVRLIEVDRAL